MNKRSGFTLIELLVVIAVLAILCTIVIGASSMMMQTSRARRYSITAEVLKVAIMRYRTEYGVWPVDRDEKFDSHNGDWYYLIENNDKVIDALRTCIQGNDLNPEGIRFIDETTIYTSDGDNMIPFNKVTRNTGNPIVYRVKHGHYKGSSKKWDYYKIGFNFRDDTVSVGPVGDSMTTGGVDDEY